MFESVRRHLYRSQFYLFRSQFYLFRCQFYLSTSQCFDCFIGSVTFEVTVASGSDKFEVCGNRNLVASDRVSMAATDELDTEDETSSDYQLRLMKLDGDDVCKELRLRGYDYGPTFRGILSADGDGELT